MGEGVSFIVFIFFFVSLFLCQKLTFCRVVVLGCVGLVSSLYDLPRTNSEP